MVGTDAVIGTFASLHDPSLIQNRCFLYHLIGNQTGEWRVPVGGMGAVTDALAAAASSAGAEIITSAGVSSINAGDDGAEVTWHDGRSSNTVSARFVLANVAPWVLRILMGEPEEAATKPRAPRSRSTSAQPAARLKSGIDPSVAFAGHPPSRRGLHPARGGVRRRRGRPRALGHAGGGYCHSLSDPSILGSATATPTP